LSKLRVLDLFSGIGGFSLGLERAGMETVAFVEREPFCQKVLAKHWPEIPIYDDVQQYRGDEHECDVVCGGFPCQDISLAGRGAGLAGERSGLWREMARIIGVARPQYVIVENVAALLGRGLGDVLGDLATLGFDAEWHCIPASAVGAPHRRDRVWIVAYSKGERSEKARQHSQRPTERASRCGTILAYANFTGQADGKRREESAECERVRTANYGRGAGRWLGQWPAEPPVGRVVDGVPGWMDRVGALGNAVVPQIPEIIGRSILEARP
jgi:DNA (cytosine-5)-methyltransferase 1